MLQPKSHGKIASRLRLWVQLIIETSTRSLINACLRPQHYARPTFCIALLVCYTVERELCSLRGFICIEHMQKHTCTTLAIHNVCTFYIHRYEIRP